MPASLQETLDLVRKAQTRANDEIAKTINLATGLVAYDLQAPSKNLYPVLTPIRNRIPRVGGGTGTATNWRQVSAILGSGYDSMPWVPEGQRSSRMSYTTANKSATYATIGEEDLVVALLEEDDVVIYPGFFFDFAHEAFLVASLLPQPDVFERAVRRVLARCA